MIKRMMLVIGLSFGISPAFAQDSYLDDIAKVASGDNQYAENGDSTGTYMMTPRQLEIAGLLKLDEKSLGKNGDVWSSATFQDNEFQIKSRKDFEGNKKAQTYYMKKYMAQAMDTFPGGKHDVSEKRLAECVWYLGDYGCKRFLDKGSTGNKSVDDQVTYFIGGDK